MFKRKTIIVLVIIVFLLVIISIQLFGIFNTASTKSTDYIMTKPIIINNTMDIATENESKQKLTSLIPLSPSEILLGIISYDLNQDDSEEQIHIVRKQNDPAGHIVLIIAAYNVKTKIWFRLMECETLVTQLKTLNLRFQAITNDSIMSLICEGLNEKNESTLTIYRIIAKPETSANFTLVQVFSDYGDSVAFDTAQSSKDYSIVVSRTVPEAPDTIIEERYEWDFEQSRYAKKLETTIAKDKIINSKIEKLLASTKEEITQFITGIWYRNAEKNQLYIDFQFNEEKIIFSLEDYSEIYSIDSITMTNRGLYISCINQSIASLKRYITLEIRTETSIEVRMFQNLGVKGDSAIDWNGTYSRFYGSTKSKSIFEQLPKEIILSFNGTYKNDTGIQLVLNAPEYSLSKTANDMEHGFFYILLYKNQYILDCIPVNAQGATRKAFFIKKKIQNKLASKATILELVPIKITLKGPVETGETIIELSKQ
ncbi:MAG TPA: pallilysin-related adhesin [Spirochaetales bacterium]|nr:pallilysin-related adhesin [Spirochaetales bacterium]HQK33430.1 pallilysin-related adhesin [Spirochaetales bacterium]